MKRLPLLTLSLVSLPLLAFAGRDVESFSSYAPGLLAGAGDWKGEEKPGAVQVQPGQLKLEGFGAPSSGRIFLPATASKVHEAFLHLPTERTEFYFSFLIRVDQTQGLSNERPFGIFRMAHNAENPAVAGIYIKQSESEGDFLIVGSKRANPAKTSTVPTSLKIGEVHLIVGRYNTSTSPHSFDLWINPPKSSYKADAPPSPSLSITDGVDLPRSVNSLIVGGGVGSPGILIDEICVGDSWAEVTQ